MSSRRSVRQVASKATRLTNKAPDEAENRITDLVEFGIPTPHSHVSVCLYDEAALLSYAEVLSQCPRILFAVRRFYRGAMR